MIISASRRTDLPAFYAEWLCRRFSEGYVLVRNPFRPRQVSRIPLTPEAVEGIVFWTKNPLPLAPHLSRFGTFPWYFQWTLTPYGRDIEPGLPEKERLIAAFHALADRYGAHRFVWRYDPILLSPAWTVRRHMDAFDAFCQALAGASDRCIISFLDSYRHRARILRAMGIRSPDEAERAALIAAFRRSAGKWGFSLRACCEEELPPAACIDTERLGRIGGVPLRFRRDRSQRAGCTCAEAVDIGAYSTCPAGCCYCYAVRSTVRPSPPDAAILGAPLSSEDTVRDRATSPRLAQPSLFTPGKELP